MSSHEQRVILLAEDDPDDQMFARKALNDCQTTIRIEVVHDGEQLMQYLRREGPYSDDDTAPLPDVILLDLNMPRMNGREALHQIKRDAILKRIPVIVLTTSNASPDILDSYDRGTNAYIVKPLNYESMCAAMNAIGQFWFNTARLTSRDSR